MRVSTGVSANGMPRNGEGFLVSQPAVSTAASPSAAQTCAPAAETPTAGSASQRELADPTLAATAAKREQLKYLVRCASSADVALYADIDGERFTFPGSIGLAPRWLTEAMAPSEERWVSACLLAHVNYFGKHVRISIRATAVSVPELKASADEQQTFSIFEGGFFGNPFRPLPSRLYPSGRAYPRTSQRPHIAGPGVYPGDGGDHGPWHAVDGLPFSFHRTL